MLPARAGQEHRRAGRCKAPSASTSRNRGPARCRCKRAMCVGVKIASSSVGGPRVNAGCLPRVTTWRPPQHAAARARPSFLRMTALIRRKTQSSTRCCARLKSSVSPRLARRARWLACSISWTWTQRERAARKLRSLGSPCAGGALPARCRAGPGTRRSLCPAIKSVGWVETDRSNALELATDRQLSLVETAGAGLSRASSKARACAWR